MIFYTHHYHSTLEIVHSKNIVKGNDMFLKLPLNI